jgi:FAD:protein FMN transferase
MPQSAKQSARPLRTSWCCPSRVHAARHVTFRVALLAALLVAIPSAASAPADAPTSERLVRRARPAFGVTVEVLARVEGDEAARVAVGSLDAALDEVVRIEMLADEANARSAVAALNALAGDEPVVLEPELFFLVAEAQRLAKLTRGAFDVTAAAYVGAWPFGVRAVGTDGSPPPSAAPDVPSKNELDRARALVGYQDLVLDAASRTARLRSPGARVSVLVLARGYALDRAAQALIARGVENFIISAGGDLVVRGDKGGRPWMVGVQDPRAAGHFAALPAPLKGAGAVMTSGDYEEFFFDGGVRYHSILDPRTGQPATQCRSVSVIAADALTAEALSRAVFVMGPKDGIALLERLKDVEAVIVTADNRVVVTKGLKGVVQSRPPTDGP